jgi:hypothetical protein
VTGSGEALDDQTFHQACERLSDEDDQILRGCDQQDNELALAVQQAGAYIMAFRWYALEQLLTYLRSDQCARDTHARLPEDERRYFLQLMVASGWWAPPTHADGDGW